MSTVNIPNPENMSLDWLDCVDYLIELGFPHKQAYDLTYIYSIDDNFAGYRDIVCKLVEMSIDKSNLNEIEEKWGFFIKSIAPHIEDKFYTE